MKTILNIFSWAIAIIILFGYYLWDTIVKIIKWPMTPIILIVLFILFIPTINTWMTDIWSYLLFNALLLWCVYPVSIVCVNHFND